MTGKFIVYGTFVTLKHRPNLDSASNPDSLSYTFSFILRAQYIAPCKQLCANKGLHLSAGCRNTFRVDDDISALGTDLEGAMRLR